MSDTVLVAIITACATFIPTIISIIINNYFQLKIKRFELNECAKREAVTNYLNALGNWCYKPTKEDINNYQKAVTILLYYFPNLDTQALKNGLQSINEESLTSKLELTLPIVKELSKLRKEI